MTQIIAAHFPAQEEMEAALDQLIQSGFSEDKISTFYLNPPGQHDLYPIGGDRDISPGAKESTGTLARGAVAGGMIGGATGVAGIPVVGPIAPAVGAMVGAHVGSLIGSLSGMKEANEEEQGHENTTPKRKSGMILAVGIKPSQNKDTVIELLKSSGADQIERANGTIKNGNWEDFDPLKPPVLVH